MSVAAERNQRGETFTSRKDSSPLALHSRNERPPLQPAKTSHPARGGPDTRPRGGSHSMQSTRPSVVVATRQEAHEATLCCILLLRNTDTRPWNVRRQSKAGAPECRCYPSLSSSMTGLLVCDDDLLHLVALLDLVH